MGSAGGAGGRSVKGTPQVKGYSREKGLTPCNNFLSVKTQHGRKASHTLVLFSSINQVLEIRPSIKWDKGKALEFLLEMLGNKMTETKHQQSTSLASFYSLLIFAAGFADCESVVPVYIGDDRTDEDAFEVHVQRCLAQ